MTPPKKAAKTHPPTSQVEPQTPPEKGIGVRIKDARERLDNGLSIEALSRMCKLVDPSERGIAQQTLVKYEKGVVLPGLRELRILSVALDVSTDWLIFGAERGAEGSPVITMDAALSELAAVLRERIGKAEDPLWFLRSVGDRPRLLAQARTPKPRE